MKEKYQVIIIDDEAIMTKLLRLVLLDDLYCEVEVFNDPEAAYERLLVKNFDVISLDHRMPKLLGGDLLKSLRSKEGLNSKTPVLLFTGFKEEAELSAQLLDDVIFLEKPIDNSSYLRQIKFALQMKYQSVLSEK